MKVKCNTKNISILNLYRKELFYGDVSLVTEGEKLFLDIPVIPQKIKNLLEV